MPSSSDYCDTQWWRSYFSGVALDVWRAIVPPEQAIRDADYLEAVCGLAQSAKLLDVPCGDGRVAIELASRGFDVTGVDVSAEILDDAKRRAVERGVRATWHHGDMRQLPWDADFDAAFCWGDSFGYFDEAGNREFLASLRRSLRPGAVFAMEMGMIAEVLFPHFQPRISGKVGDVRLTLERVFDPRSARLHVHYTFERDAQRECREASYRIHTCREVCQLLADAGFVVERLEGLPGEAFRLGASCLHVLARSGR